VLLQKRSFLHGDDKKTDTLRKLKGVSQEAFAAETELGDDIFYSPT
jgi:hypothetical protein